MSAASETNLHAFATNTGSASSNEEPLEAIVPEVPGEHVEAADLLENAEHKVSKKALKRKAKAERFEATKLLKRAAYKERKKERKRLAREAEQGGDTQKDDKEAIREPVSEEMRIELRAQRKLRQEKKASEFDAKARRNYSIIIDCKWDELHNERNHKSLAQQIMQSYGYNKASEKPVHMYVTGISAKFKEHLDKLNTHAWMGATFVQEDDYFDLPYFKVGTASEGVQKQLVYLSSDADEVLDELDERCAYIIGGIVDRNKHKGIAHNKAVRQGVRTVKLPITEHLKLHATHVLTVNHVFQLLLERSVDA